MYFLRYEAAPRPGSKDAGQRGGAFICCWLERPSLREAVEDAERFIDEEGWDIKEEQEAHAVARSAYQDDSEFLQYFEQAEIEKQVFVFHSWPAES